MLLQLPDIDARSALEMKEAERIIGLTGLLDSGCTHLMIGADNTGNYTPTNIFENGEGPKVAVADDRIKTPKSIGYLSYPTPDGKERRIRAYDMSHVFSKTLFSISQLDVLGFTCVFRHGHGGIFRNENVTIITKGSPFPLIFYPYLGYRKTDIITAKGLITWS